MKFFLNYWLPVIFWAALIFYLSSRPGLRVAYGFWDFATRKPAHIVEYAVLYLLVYRALNGGIKKQELRIKNLILAFILTVIYAVTDEYHQTFIPLREGKITDIFIDGFGSILGFLIVRLKKNL